MLFDFWVALWCLRTSFSGFWLWAAHSAAILGIAIGIAALSFRAVLPFQDPTAESQTAVGLSESVAIDSREGEQPSDSRDQPPDQALLHLMQDWDELGLNPHLDAEPTGFTRSGSELSESEGPTPAEISEPSDTVGIAKWLNALAFGLVLVSGYVGGLSSTRNRKLGLLLALGASPASLLRMLAWNGLFHALLGSTLALLLVLGLKAWLPEEVLSPAWVLLGVSWQGWVPQFSYLLVALPMLALLASLIPAYQLLYGDPAKRLRRQS